MPHTVTLVWHWWMFGWNSMHNSIGINLASSWNPFYALVWIFYAAWYSDGELKTKSYNTIILPLASPELPGLSCVFQAVNCSPWFWNFVTPETPNNEAHLLLNNFFIGHTMFIKRISKQFLTMKGSDIQWTNILHFRVKRWKRPQFKDGFVLDVIKDIQSEI